MLYEVITLKYAGKWVFYFVLIGVMSGLGAILFHYLCGLGMHYFMDMMAGYSVITSYSIHYTKLYEKVRCHPAHVREV